MCRSPALYGRLPGNKFMLIPTFALAYYHAMGDDPDMYAMPLGLRMVVGDNGRRSGPGSSGGDRLDTTPNWHCHSSRGADTVSHAGFPGMRSSTGQVGTPAYAR